LNLRGCKFTDTGFQELLQSKSLHSVEVLVVRDNKIKKIEGPYGDLEEATEKQIRKGIMRLRLLDIRGNRLSHIIQADASNFLEETVVLMWGNPFECDTT
jgi:Leucine-rich repeat (LRR) protein